MFKADLQQNICVFLQEYFQSPAVWSSCYCEAHTIKHNLWLFHKYNWSSFINICNADDTYIRFKERINSQSVSQVK